LFNYTHRLDELPSKKMIAQKQHAATSLKLLLAIVVISFSCTDSKTDQKQNTDVLSIKPITALEVDSVVGQFAGSKAVLVNVWATWCIPCIEELPYIVRVREEFQEDFEVVFISADFDDAIDRVEQFLAENNVHWQTYLKNDRDEPFIDAVWKDWSGAIPATVVYSKSGEFITAFERPATYEEFRELALTAIQ
jgi:thiol-disulfide isomerase/thioredoxin